MSQEAFERLLEFVEQNRDRIEVALILQKCNKLLKERDEEIENLKKELNSYRTKLKEEVKLELASESINPILKVHILECGLPQYVARDLYQSKYDFSNLGEVLKYTKKEIISIRGFGGKRLAILESFLKEHGLKFAE